MSKYPSAIADWAEEEVKREHAWSAQATKSILYMIFHISFSTGNRNEHSYIIENYAY